MRASFIIKAILLIATHFCMRGSIYAQALSGIPDNSVNPNDSGILVSNAVYHLKTNLFPSINGGVFFHVENRKLPNFGFVPYEGAAGYIDSKGAIPQLTNFGYNLDGRANSFFSLSPVEQYAVINPGFRYRPNCNGMWLCNYDSLRFVRLMDDNGLPSPTPVTFHSKIHFPFSYRGDFRDGFHHLGTPNKKVFILSYNPDTTAVHNEVHIFPLIHNFPLEYEFRLSGSPVVLTDKLLQKTDVQNNQLYVLTTSPTGGNTQIQVFNESLQPVSQSFAGLNLSLLGGRPEIFKVLPDGKILLAGRLLIAGQYRQALIRLNADGSIDPGFAQVLPGDTSGLKWDLAYDGRIRIGRIDTAGANNKVLLERVGVNGGIEFSRTFNIDPLTPLGKAKMYHPGRDAFLFETEIVIGPLDPNNTYNQYIYVHRFYVDFNGVETPLVQANGFAPNDNAEGIGRINKRLKRIVHFSRLEGYWAPITYNQKFLPHIQIIRPDGSVEPEFKGYYALPKSFRDSIRTNSVTMNPYLVGGKKLLFVTDGNLGGFTYRFHLDGGRDPSFQPFISNGSLFEDRDGSFIALQYSLRYQLGRESNPEDSLVIVRIDSLGNYNQPLAKVGLDPVFDPVGEYGRLPFTLGRDNQNGLWVLVSKSESGTNIIKKYFVRISPNGRVKKMGLDSIEIDWQRLWQPFPVDVRVLQNGNFRILLNTTASSTGSFKAVSFVFDSNGVFISKSEPIQPQDGFGPRVASDILLDTRLSDGKYLVKVMETNERFFYLRYFQDGRLDPSFLPIESMLTVGTFLPEFVAEFDKRLILGRKFSRSAFYSSRINVCGPLNKNGLYSFSINSFPSNVGYVQGRVESVASPATGCNPTGTRTPSNLIMLKAEPGNAVAFTNAQGAYAFALQPGNYNVSQLTSNDFLRRQICPAAATPNRLVTLASGGDVSLNNNFINQNFNCPRLSMQVLQPRFRLCSRSTFTINYSNDGMAAEPNARIRLTLPKLVKLESASRPFVLQADSSYVFDIGNLAPGQGGQITVRDTIGCPTTPDSAARACFSVRMEPLNACGEVQNANIGWNNAWLDAKAQWNPQTDQVRFAVYNRGANMTDSTRIAMGGSFNRRIKLNSNDSLVFTLPAIEQGAYRLTVEQPDRSPLGRTSSLTQSGRNSARFYLAFEDGWFSQQTATACPEFRYSYDPNEKVVEPVDPVNPGTELSYTIHFENFGNDTAYTVIIADTLPPGVDISTFRMVGASHTCTPRLDGTVENPVIFFNFIPIKLTAKRQDSIRSKGQVDFKIRLKPNVELGSEHRNTAHIYFDRNPAIVTNTVVTKVREPIFPTGTPALVVEQKGLMAYPNPARDILHVQIPKSSKTMLMQLQNLQGKVVMQKHINQSGQFDVKHLPDGLYVLKASGLKPASIIISR